MDNLVHYSQEKEKYPIPPKGKYVFGLIQLNEDGTIKIPDQAKEIFQLHAKDQLILLGDEKQGLALIKEESFLNMIEHMKQGDFYE